MKKGDVSAAREYLMECAVLNGKRIPNDAFDYGDEQTVMLHLKRVGSVICDDKEDNYGIYLGHHSDGYVVGIKDLFGRDFIGCEVFDSVEEMKVTWQLD